MQTLSIAAFLLTGSAGIVLLLMKKHRLLFSQMPALLVFLLLDLPLYGILLYLHADTPKELLRIACLGSGFAVLCFAFAILLQKRKKASLYSCGELASVTASLQLFTMVYIGAALLYLNNVQEHVLTRDICLIIMEHLLLFSMISCILCLQGLWHQHQERSEAGRQLNRSLVRIRQRK